MNRQLYSAVVIFLLLWVAIPTTSAQEEQRPAEETKELIVVAEDELAPVQAIQERIDARLAGPIDGLDLELIMEGADFFGTRPGSIRWDGDGSRFWFDWKRWDEDEEGRWQYVVATGELTRLSKEEELLVPHRRATWDERGMQAAWSDNGSLMYYRTGDRPARVLFQGAGSMQPLHFSSSGDLFVTYNGNVALLSISGGSPLLQVLTDLRKGNEQDDEPKTESQRWNKAQQLALFDTLRTRHDRREAERTFDEARRIKPYYLKSWEAGALIPSPDAAWVAVTLRQESRNARVADMPTYVTESGYTESRPTRTKVGDEQDKAALAIVEAGSGLGTMVDLGLEERAVDIFPVVWNNAGDAAVVQVRAQDHKDRWLLVLTPSVTEGDAGKELVVEVTEVHHETDEAWINWSVAPGVGWLPDDSGVFFLTEISGKRHIHAVDATGDNARALTSGDYVVSSPGLSSDERFIYYQASLPGNPHQQHTFALPVGGGEALQVSGGMGRTDATPAPQGGAVAVVASSETEPWELYVNRGISAELGTKVTDSPSPAFKSLELGTALLTTITAEDGTQVPAQIYLPEQPAQNRPGVVFVHGAGYMQNVHSWWRSESYARVYLFNHLLADLGYTVIDTDFRGSAGYGRDWRTAIYRHMGGKDLSDQVDAARYIVENHGVDPGRIGLYGGSYGGFITLMGMFLHPETFAAGAAMRPVTDWAAYNHPYTSNILNTPQADPESYLRSSPIYHAEGLEGALLICHGIVDNNVHFQGVVRLVQRLMELRKENWELAIYPLEPHGFSIPSSWVDEYRRILELFDENLKN